MGFTDVTSVLNEAILRRWEIPTLTEKQALISIAWIPI